MSICPERDIHSVYLDGELNSPYCSRYELHLAACSVCRSEAARLERLHLVMSADSAALGMTRDELDNGFARLQTRMRFHEVTSSAKKADYPFARWSAPVAVAALLVALFLPFGIMQISSRETGPAVAPVTLSNQTVPIAANGVVTDGNITHATLSSIFGSASAAAGHVSFHSAGLSSIDIFRPEFDTPAEPMSINITLTPVSGLPVFQNTAGTVKISEIQLIYTPADMQR